MGNYFKSIDNLFKANLFFRAPCRIEGGLKWYGIIILAIFVLGLIILMINPSRPLRESFDLKRQCPNILVQKGKYIFLHNTRLAKIPGVNPIKFNNLEDYVEYVNWQRSQNINCPVLFLQHSYDAQGNAVYKNRPSPMDLHGGLPPIPGLNQQEIIKSKLLDAGHDDPPYNQNLYPGFDPDNQYIGLKTPLDKMFHQNPSKVSPSAMDANWGGPKYTQKLIDKGVYQEENVKIAIPD